MPRVMVYIPDELRGRMRNYDSINWSSAAQKAFERAITQHERDIAMSQSLVKRLRASRAEYEEKQKEDGRSAGQWFAENKADYDDLVRLRKVDAANEGWAVHPKGQFGNLAQAYKDVFNYRGVLEHFFGDADDEPSDDFVDAFVSAALENLEAAAERLDAPDDEDEEEGEAEDDKGDRPGASAA
jgi:post-segregation antitoxin (ccd killing protein)